MSYGLCISGVTGSNGPQQVRTDPGFSCRIALSSGQPGGGGFITFPGGGFTLDPASDVAINSPPGEANHPSNFGYTFRAGRWLPVKREWVSPDGSRYAYTDSTGIHVISVADSTDTVIGKGQGWQLVALDNVGVYAVPANHTIGLWFLPLIGSPKQVTDRGLWLTIGGGIAYGLVAQSVPNGVSNPVLRLDLATGAIRTWWTDPPQGLGLLGTDPGGSLLVSIPSQAYPYVDVRRMSGPDAWTPLFYDFNYQGRYLTQPVVVDSRGTWLSDNGGIWFSSPRGTLLVSTVFGQLASGCE